MSRDVRQCDGCGAKNRADWRVCQRCRRDLRPAPAPPPPRGGQAWPWLATAGVIAIGAMTLLASSARHAARPATTVTPPAPPAGEAVLERRSTPGPAQQVVLSPVTKEDFARAGEAAYAQGKMGVALSAFETAVASFPSDPDARNNLGQLLVRVGRVAEALPHLEAAVAADPARWTYRFNLARARGLGGDWPGAVADYRVAAQIFPDDPVTLYNLGRALQRLDQHAGAAASLERAVALAPAEPSFLLALAGSYEKLSRLPEAIHAYREFLEREPLARDAQAIRARIERLAQVGVPDGPAVATSAPSSDG